MYCTKYIENLNIFFNELPSWYYIIPYIIHFISSIILYNKTKDISEKNPPLYDIIISNTPDLSNYDIIPNILLCFIFSFLLIPLFFNENFKILYSFFKYFSLIILIRTITTQVTILPPTILEPQRECKYEKNFFDIICICLDGHNLDKIFSGHTAASLLLVLLYFKYNILEKNSLYLLLGLQILLSLTLILTRGHYTIDVLLAYIITFGIFLLLDL